jgi:hypothetical protein
MVKRVKIYSENWIWQGAVVQTKLAQPKKRRRDCSLSRSRRMKSGLGVFLGLLAEPCFAGGQQSSNFMKRCLLSHLPRGFAVVDSRPDPGIRACLD